MMLENQSQKLYSDLSSWWHLFSPPADYEKEAAFYKKIFLTNDEFTAFVTILSNTLYSCYT